MEVREEGGSSVEGHGEGGEGAGLFYGASRCGPRRFSGDELHALVEAGADWLWETDNRHRFTWFSEDFERRTGVAPATALGRSRIDFMKNVAQPGHGPAAHLADLEAHRPFRNFVYESADARSDARWVSVSGNPRFDVAGNFVGYRGVARNVTGIASAIEQLSEARQQLSSRDIRANLAADNDPGRAEQLFTALNAMQDAFGCYDKDGRLTVFNQAMVAMYPGLEDVIRPGVTFLEIARASLERGLSDTGGMDGEEWLRARIVSHRQEGQTTFRLADGRWLMRRTMEAPDGGRIAITTDVSALKRNEVRLEAARAEAEAAEQRLHSAINALHDGFVLWDKDDRLVAWNKAYERYFPDGSKLQPGRTHAEMLADVAYSGRVVDARGREEDWAREVLSSLSAEIGRERIFQTHDGRWISRRDEVTVNGDTVGVRSDISEQKLREAELAAANQTAGAMLADMKRALDGMRMGVVLLDADLNAELINRAFYDIWSLEPDRLALGSPFRALMDINRHNGIYDVAETDWEAYVADRLAEIRAGDVAPREFLRADDHTMIYSVTALSGGKRLICYYDITDLKQREADLAHASAQSRSMLSDLQRMLDSVKMGLMLLDSDLKAEVINQAFYELWNLTPEELPVGSPFGVGMNINRSRGMYSHIAEADWPDYVASRQAEVRAGDTAPREFRRADGRTLIYSAAALSGGKRLICYYDISELKDREARLADALEQSQLAKMVIDGIVDPVFVKDENLRFVMANQAFSRIFGRAPDEIVGKTAADVVGQADAERFEATEREALDTGNSYEAAEDFVEDDQPKSRVVRKSRMELPSGGRYVAGFLFDVTEIKRRERDAEQARKHLADVLDSLPIGVIIYDRDDRFVMANRQLRETMEALSPIWVPGKSFREAVEFGHSIGFFRSSGDPAIDALYDNDYASWLEVYMARHRLPHAEFERRNLDGRWYQVVDTRSADGTFIGVRVDISDMKQREEALYRSMNQVELFRRALDELPVSTFIKSADLRIAYANKAWEDFTGFSPEETVGHTDAELFNLTDADSYVKADAEVWSKGKEVVIEEPVGNRDGTVRQVLTRKNRLVASDGTTYLLGSSMDISDLKKREAELQKSLRENELFRNLIDNVPVAIYAKRPDLRLLYVNAGWTFLTGFTSEEAIGKTDVEIFGGEGEQYTIGDLAVLNSNGTHETEELATAPDGKIRYQIARKSAMVASDGSLYLIGSTTDVTELKQREKELEDARREAVLADRAKSEFLANMSHEIRTPMNGVLGMAELLAKSQLNPKQKTFTDIIVKSGNALLTIINDILDFSKIDAGQLVLDPAPFNLAEAVEDVATLVSTRAKEKDLELIVRVEPGLSDHFVGDVGRVRQIITNLLGNAVKFTDRGHVLVDVSGVGEGENTKVRVSVTDTGIGIPAGKLSQIFEKFSQVDGSSTRRHEGTGLGLAIASRLVTMMDGEIGVESEEGKGSTFWFTMKLPNAGQIGTPRITPLDVTGARILIVDDNAVNRAILTEQMNSWTFDSCAAESGPEGIKVLEAAAAFGVGVDCVVLDYQMPDMTGVEAARLIRATPAIAETPIVLLTSVDQALTNAGYRELGIDAQLIKPARSSILLETIVSAIQRRRSDASGEPSIPVIGQMVRDWTPASAPAAPAPVRLVEPDSRSQPAAGSNSHRLDILVAEDNEVNQLVFTQILSETGLSFEIVANGRLAVESWREMTPRMILMDVSMPEMNGLQATAAIREAEAALGTRTPIVGVTAHALKGDRERCIEAGMDDYLSKPISPKALLDKVERWSGFGDHSRREAM